jgi:hypothetical protein
MRLIMALLIVLVPSVSFAKGECKEDKKKFCKDVVEAKGDVGDCLEKHLSELSEACKTKQQTKSDNPAHENKAGDTKSAPEGSSE